MKRIFLEAKDPFATPSIQKRVVTGLAIAVVGLVAIGGAVWVRFQPAVTQTAPAAISVIRPAWGMASALAPPASTATTATPGDTVSAVSAKATKPRGKPKAKSASRRDQSPKARNPAAAQVAKTPTGN